MAISLLGYKGVITLVDQGGNPAHKVYNLREPTVAADALADLVAIAALLDPITSANIRNYTLHTLYYEDAFGFPTGGVQIENIAELTVLLSAGLNKTAQIQIPAPVDGLFVASAGKGYNTVDIGDSALFAYVDGVYGETGGLAYISDGEMVADLAGIQSGKRVHRRSRKG